MFNVYRAGISYKVRKTAVVLLLISGALCLCSCTQRKRSSISVGEQEIPDIVMKDADYSFGRKNDSPVIFSAGEITIWSGDNPRTELKDVSFSQKGKDGEISLSGMCDSAVVENENTLARLYGNVRLEKTDDKLIIECDSLVWDDEKSTVETDSEVQVWYGSDMYVNANGFSAAFNSNMFEFSRVIEGKIETGEPENEDETNEADARENKVQGND